MFPSRYSNIQRATVFRSPPFTLHSECMYVGRGRLQSMSVRMVHFVAPDLSDMAILHSKLDFPFVTSSFQSPKRALQSADVYLFVDFSTVARKSSATISVPRGLHQPWVTLIFVDCCLFSFHTHMYTWLVYGYFDRYAQTCRL